MTEQNRAAGVSPQGVVSINLSIVSVKLTLKGGVVSGSDVFYVQMFYSSSPLFVMYAKNLLALSRLVNTINIDCTLKT
jgi:hypothetical protein